MPTQLHSTTNATPPGIDNGAKQNQRILAIHVPTLNWLQAAFPVAANPPTSAHHNTQPHGLFCKQHKYPLTAHSRGGGGGSLRERGHAPTSPNSGGPGGDRPPQGSWYAMRGISIAIPSTKQPRFLLYISTKLQNNVHKHMSLHTLIQVSFTSHNATNHTSILFPYNSTITFCIIALFYHLAFLSLSIAMLHSFS